MSQIQFKTVWDKKAPLQRQKTKKELPFISILLNFFFFFRKSAFKDFIIVWHCDLERQKKFLVTVFISPQSQNKQPHIKMKIPQNTSKR